VYSLRYYFVEVVVLTKRSNEVKWTDHVLQRTALRSLSLSR
jgi:hypothetical protein